LGEAKIKAGHLLASSINFLIVCFVVFVFARLIVRAAKK
jgi:large-conductance mechanosensitive channel